MTSASATLSLRELVHLASFAAGVILGLEVTGCSGDVTIDDQVGAGGGGGTTTTGVAGCAGSGTGAVHDEVLSLSNVRSGLFIGDTLHLEATLDGKEGYHVLALDPQGIARVQPPSGMGASATLVEVSPGVHVRLRPGAEGLAHVEWIDTSTPESPAISADRDVEGFLDDPPVFTVVGEQLYFCLRPTPDDEAQLAMLDVSDPTKPAEPQILESFLCNLFADDEHAASGPNWINWDHPTGFYVQSTYAYVMDGTGVKKTVDYGYNQTGVHQYGNVLTASVSPFRAAFDPENASQFLLLNPAPGVSPSLAWAQLSLGEPARLLGVADMTMYLSTAGGIRAYDIEDIEAPVLKDFEAKVAFAAGAPRLLAASERYLAVLDGEGVLFLVPRKDPGTVNPLQIHATDYAPATDPECGG